MAPSVRQFITISRSSCEDMTGERTHNAGSVSIYYHAEKAAVRLTDYGDAAQDLAAGHLPQQPAGIGCRRLMLLQNYIKLRLLMVTLPACYQLQGVPGSLHGHDLRTHARWRG